MIHRRFPARCAPLLLLFASVAAAAAPPPDKLDRENPRSTVIAFMQACRRHDYNLAAHYLDLHSLSDQDQKSRGPELAKKLEAALNASPHFDPLQLTQTPDAESPDQITALVREGATYPIKLERVVVQSPGPPVWIFSSDTVRALANMNLSFTAPWLTRYLPPVLTQIDFLETPLWKWLALLLAAVVLLSFSRLLDRILVPIFRIAGQRFLPNAPWAWSETVIRPIRVLLSIFVFRLWMELVDPSAIAKVYIGRGLELLVIWSIAWCLVCIVDQLLSRVETRMASRQEFSGRSILRLGRRTASLTIVILAILMVLSSWGYNTATLIAGLGVGGIAVALAAQQTIANIFGGISVIGDRPVAIGDFGKFGDLVGTVEDIGMRSTRVRTLNRTLVSVPNSTFAGANLENYSQRDKILFNPTFQIKRTIPDDQIRGLIETLQQALKRDSIELVPTPVRLIALSAAAYNLEIFCYVLTRDIDRFYNIQSDLLLAINQALQNAHIELA